MNTIEREITETSRLERMVTAALKAEGCTVVQTRPGVLVYTAPDGHLWHAEVDVTVGGWADLAEAEQVLT